MSVCLSKQIVTVMTRPDEAPGRYSSLLIQPRYVSKLPSVNTTTQPPDLAPLPQSFSEINLQRNGLFVLFGAGYLGCFQWYIMVTKYRVWFPTMDVFAKLSFAEKFKHKAGMIDAGKMVLFDIFVHMPVMYFPTYYTMKEFVFGDSWSPVSWVKVREQRYLRQSSAAPLTPTSLPLPLLSPSPQLPPTERPDQVLLKLPRGLQSHGQPLGALRLHPVRSPHPHQNAVQALREFLLDGVRFVHEGGEQGGGGEGGVSSRERGLGGATFFIHI